MLAQNMCQAENFPNHPHTVVLPASPPQLNSTSFAYNIVRARSTIVRILRSIPPFCLRVYGAVHSNWIAEPLKYCGKLSLIISVPLSTYNV